MNTHTSSGRPESKSCKLELSEQILLPNTAKNEVENFVVVKAGRLVNEQMRQSITYPTCSVELIPSSTVSQCYCH